MSHASTLAFSASQSSPSELEVRDVQLGGAPGEGDSVQTEQFAGLADGDLPAAKQVHHDGFASGLIEGLLPLKQRGQLVIKHHRPHGFAPLFYVKW